MPGASPGYHHAAAARRRPSAGRGLLPLDHLLEVASRRASPGAPPPGSTSAMPTPDPGPSHFARVRRMRLRATTTTGTTTWRVGPQGLRFLGGGGVLPGAAGDPYAGPSSRPPAGVVVGEPAPGRSRVAGTGALRRNGGFVRESVRNVWPAGCWGSSPGRLYLFSPVPLPSHGPCLSSVDRSNPAISGHRKSGHFRRPETGVDFYFRASFERKAVWTLVRQLRGPHLSTWA